MKEDTVIFVPPDKDLFEKQKGKTLNNWIKQYMGVHEQKRNFEEISEHYGDLYRDA